MFKYCLRLSLFVLYPSLLLSMLCVDELNSELNIHDNKVAIVSDVDNVVEIFSRSKSIAYVD